MRALVVLSLGVALLVSGTTGPSSETRVGPQELGTSGFPIRGRGRGSGIAAAVLGLTRSLLGGAMSVDATLELIGTAAIVIGIVGLLGEFRDDARERPRPARRIVLAVSEIVLGLVWTTTATVASSAAYAIGMWALLGGTIMLIDVLDASGGRAAVPPPADTLDARSAERRLSIEFVT